MTEERTRYVVSEDLPAFVDFLLRLAVHHVNTCGGDTSHALCIELDGTHYDMYTCLTCSMAFSFSIPKVVSRADPYTLAVTPVSLVEELVP